MEVATLHTLASTTPLLPYYLNAMLNDATNVDTYAPLDMLGVRVPLGLATCCGTGAD